MTCFVTGVFTLPYKTDLTSINLRTMIYKMILGD